jgi:hypothetical protein
VWVTVEVRNDSGQSRGVYFGSRHSTYAFTIINRATSQKVEANPLNLNPNTSIFGRFRLDELYRLAKPGSYSIEVTDGRPIINRKQLVLTSNTIAIAIVDPEG